MKLPNPEKAIIAEEKIRDYLLSNAHPIGRFKAAVFRGLGYRQSDLPRLHAEIKVFLRLDAVERETTEYGKKYEIRSELSGPNGKSIYLVTAWIVLRTEDLPRFVTAYPGERE